MESWLSELGISSASLESNFSNGYLLGSILYRYNLQDDFGSFSTKPSYASSNLAKLQQTLSLLNIKITPTRILNQDPGYVTSVLTKVFKSLHSIPVTSQKPIRGKTASSKSRPSKLEAVNPSQQRFESVRLQQSEKALKDEKQQMESIRQMYLKERQKQIDILKSNKIFMQQWESEGKKKWTNNQMRRTMRVEHEENVSKKISDERMQSRIENNLEHCAQAVDGIVEFERNMIRLGVDHVPEQKEVKKKKLDIRTEAMITMGKIKERKCVNVQATKEREVRQMNLIIEQKKNEKFDLYKRASLRLGNLLVKVLVGKYGEGFGRCKKYAKEAKKFNQSLKNVEMINKTSQDTWGKIEKDRQEKLLSDQQSKKQTFLQDKQKYSQTFLQYRKETFQDRYQKCLSITDLILSLADEGFTYLKTSEKIPNQLWSDWLTLFKSGKISLSVPKSIATPTSDIHSLVRYSFSNPPDYKQDLIDSYLQCKDHWEFLTCPNNSLLGDILETVLPIAYPDDPDPPLPEGPHYVPLKIILLGPTFSGKKTQLKKIQENFGLKAFEVPKILEDAKKVLDRKADAEDPKKKKVVEEEPEVFVSVCLETQGEDEFGRSKLIRARLRSVFGDFPKGEEENKKGKKDEVKCLGYCLINYPSTIHEAADLERHLSNFIHPSELPEPLGAIKKREALLIAKPSVKPPAPKKMFRTAWDLVIILDVDLQTCVTRAVDRRVDPAGNVYNMTFYPPPDNILPKCKTIEHPNAAEVQEQFKVFEHNKDTLVHWFSQFGSEYSTNLLVVKAGANIEAAAEIIKNRVNSVLRSKNGSELNTVREEFKVIGVEQAKELADEWERLRGGYLESLNYVLGHLDSHLQEFYQHEREVKDNFFQFLCEADEKSQIFQNIQQKINQTITAKSVFSSAEIQALEQEIDETVDLMWDVTIKRKDLAISKRQNIIDSLVLTQKTAGLMHLISLLLQAEITKYYSVINFVEKYYFFLDAKEFIHKPVPTLQIFWQDWDLKDVGFPLLKSLVTSAKSFVVNLTEHSPETHIFNTRVENIFAFAKNRLQMYATSLSGMNADLDLWIKKMVRLENSAINESVFFM